MKQIVSRIPNQVQQMPANNIVNNNIANQIQYGVGQIPQKKIIPKKQLNIVNNYGVQKKMSTGQINKKIIAKINPQIQSNPNSKIYSIPQMSNNPQNNNNISRYPKNNSKQTTPIKKLNQKNKCIPININPNVHYINRQNMRRVVSPVDGKSHTQQNSFQNNNINNQMINRKDSPLIRYINNDSKRPNYDSQTIPNQARMMTKSPNLRLPINRMQEKGLIVQKSPIGLKKNERQLQSNINPIMPKENYVQSFPQNQLERNTTPINSINDVPHNKRYIIKRRVNQNQNNMNAQNIVNRQPSPKKIIISQNNTNKKIIQRKQGPLSPPKNIVGNQNLPLSPIQQYY